MTDPIVRRFSAMLDMLSRGRFIESCDDALAEALTALHELPNGQGTAVLSITINIAAQGDQLEIKPTLKSRLPEAKAFPATPFWNKDGGLSTQHPSQNDMFPPRAIDRDAG